MIKFLNAFFVLTVLLCKISVADTDLDSFFSSYKKYIDNYKISLQNNPAQPDNKELDPRMVSMLLYIDSIVQSSEIPTELKVVALKDSLYTRFDIISSNLSSDIDLQINKVKESIIRCLNVSKFSSECYTMASIMYLYSKEKDKATATLKKALELIDASYAKKYTLLGECSSIESCQNEILADFSLYLHTFK